MTQFNKNLYDSITDAWMFVLGNNFHYGYFHSEDMDLNSATICLIDKLAGMAKIEKNDKVLDVGCGIGEPAINLYKKYKCNITGISISKRGVDLASRAVKDGGCQENVQFLQRDALDNGFPENSFDLVWQMESSHLMRDKKKLFSENFRVLKDQGVLLLCDLVLPNEFTFADLYKYKNELEILEKSFGKAKMETFEYYDQELQNAGFIDINMIDIRKWVMPTPLHWKSNMIHNKNIIMNHFTVNEYNNLLQSCDIIDAFFKNNILGYGLIRAVKMGGKHN